MRLIDADALLDAMDDTPKPNGDFTKEGFALVTDLDSAWLKGMVDAMACVELAPTVDPIKHGRWVWVNGWVSCSVCGCEPPSETNITSNYCPNCGAKMDGVVVEKSDTYSADNSEEKNNE